ncbi:protein-glutamate O-methyltransferase [Erythrobacter longus]|uniref:protein-glutamate O-methyltransferase n=1 Tax=Erythrobacter longus TaxID=1044 RepID=A0A074MEB3_ERYLO|nr:protein-glutamate O-methyltransferase CheR [Erythrobacter longus]KEO90203.1 protein-glutamate O-methyltransferase [Erythrobacter longus]
MEFSQASYKIISDLLAQRTGQQLTDSRKWRLESALSGVFRRHGIANIDQLVCLLGAASQPSQYNDLADEIVEALLNNETYFFRDKPTFDQIPLEVLPELKKRRQRERRLSIWCAGCSTGQEVHSLGMLFEEQKGLWAGWNIEILGTDISNKAIQVARKGLYTQFEIQRGLGVSAMLSYFDEAAGGWQMRENARRHSRFEEHNILTQSPGRGRFDLILCRNVLLYFGSEKRALAFQRLSNALANDGFLMLGAGETVSPHTDAFIPSGKRASIFELRSSIQGAEPTAQFA